MGQKYVKAFLTRNQPGREFINGPLLLSTTNLGIAIALAAVMTEVAKSILLVVNGVRALLRSS